MNRAPYIPDKTRQELATPAPVGQRHEQIKKIVIPLIANGLNPDAVFIHVRGMYDATITDGEIACVIRWVTRQNFKPCDPRFQFRQAVPTTSSPQKVIDFAANIRAFLNGSTADEADLWDLSPWRPLEDWRGDSRMFLAGMYHTGELVNIVTDYISEIEDGKEKAKPCGWGRALERDEAMRFIRNDGTPFSKAGGWIRPNPIDGRRLADAKGWTDANVNAFRFALLEMDTVPLDLQLSLFARLPLPINAIVTSGGRSIQALVRINAKSVEAYRLKVNELLTLLKPFGVDQSNKNPSRLCRLPGVMREIGAGEDGRQRLLYLAPDRTDSKPILRG